MFKIVGLLFYGFILCLGVYGMGTVIIDVYTTYGLLAAVALVVPTILLFSYTIWYDYQYHVRNMKTPK